MDLFLGLFFVVELALLNTGIHSLPTNIKNTFYLALQEKCTYIKDIPDFKDQTLFSKCTDWNTIGKIQNLSEDTEDDFLCLLYFDSFSLFCSELKRQVESQSQSSVNISRYYFTPKLDNYKTVQDICKNLSVFPSGKQFEHNVTKMLTNDIQCVKLCSTYGGAAKAECGLTHYFANLDVAQAINKNVSVSKPQAAVAPNKGAGEPKPPQAAASSDTHPNLAPANAVLETKIESPAGKKNITDKTVSNNDNANKPEPEAKPQGVGDKQKQSLQEIPHPQAEPAPHSQDTVAKAPQGHAQEPPKKKLSDSDNEAGAAIAPPKVVSTLVKEKAAVPMGQKEAAPNEHKEAENVNANNVGQGDETAQQPDPNLDANKAAPEIEMERPAPAQDPEFEDPVDEISQIPQSQDGDDDEEEQYKKEEQKANKEDEESKKEDEEAKEEDVKPKKNEAPAQEAEKVKPDEIEMLPNNIPISSANAGEIDGESYFFSYFMAICVLFVLGYVGYHNRQKVMALVVEGKRGKRQYRGRRPNSANYHKLDSNLEEAITSSYTKNSSHVIY